MSEVKNTSKGASANGANEGVNSIAQDIFRQASALGGFLIVSFIAPIGGVANGSSAKEQALSAVGAGAKEKMRDIASTATANLAAQQAKPGAHPKPADAPAPVLQSMSVAVTEEV